MATSQEIIAALAAAGIKIADNGVRSFREHETSAEMLPLTDLSTLLKTLTDEDVREAIDGDTTPIAKFRTPFPC